MIRMAETSTSDTLLNILGRQITGVHDMLQASGIRMVFDRQLMEPVSLMGHPFHFAALKGDLPLALYLYKTLDKQVAKAKLHVITFSSAGVNGRTPWRKRMSLRPSETALLAGHALLSKALEHMERGVPLTWSRTMHQAFPSCFKAQVEEMMGALCSCSFFIRMPQPARSLVMEAAVSQLCRDSVWGMVRSMEEAEWRDALSPALMEACAKLQQGTPGENNGSDDAPAALAAAAAGGMGGALPMYQLRFGPGAGRRRHRGTMDRVLGWMPLLLRGSVSLALCTLALKSKKGGLRSVLMAYLAGAASGVTLPGATLLIAQLLASL